MQMTTKHSTNRCVTIVDISGRIVLGEESAALRDLVCDLLGKDRRRFYSTLGTLINRQCRPGPSGQCFHERAEAGWRTETAETDE